MGLHFERILFPSLHVCFPSLLMFTNVFENSDFGRCMDFKIIIGFKDLSFYLFIVSLHRIVLVVDYNASYR